MPSPDVAIVGGGVIGCAIAYYLEGAGARVAVFEQREVGGEASGSAAGMLAPLADAAEGGPFFDLCLASLRLFPALTEALRDETGIDIEYLPSGILRVATTEAEEAELRTALRRDPHSILGLEWVDSEALRRLEPRVRPDARGAVYSAQEHQLNASRFTQTLARAAEARGAAFFQGVSVTSFITEGDQVIGLRTSEGTVGADLVVLAAGPWTTSLARRLGVNLPVRPIRGQMIAFPDFNSPLRHVAWNGNGYLVPKANGFLFAGATVEDVGFRKRTTARGLAWLERMAASLVPSLAYLEVATSWAGLRPGSPDGHPIIGPLPGWRGISVASGHFRNGILLAPITGRLMTQLLLEGRTEIPLEPLFSPARFGGRSR